MRWGTSIVDQPRSYPHGPPAVRVDDTDTNQLQAAAYELEALVLHEQARHVGDVRALLADLYQRDRVQVDDALLDAQTHEVAARERGERFLQELAIRLHPGSELLALARQLDEHALGVWQEAAASLVDEAPPSLGHLRWRVERVEEEQRAELRTHAHLVRAEAQLGAQRRRLGPVGRWWQQGWVTGLRDEEADCRARRERSGRRLAHLDAKLQVIDRAEHARAAWITNAREVLTRGVAAAQILTERQQRNAVAPAVADGSVRQRAGS
jgi:hypothetical protein